MGTQVVVTVSCPRYGARAAAVEAIAEVRQMMITFGRDGWAWGSGALAQFNRHLARGEAADIPSTLLPLFRLAWKLHKDSGGLFEPRIAAMVRLWGFDDFLRLRAEPPAAAEIDALLQALRAAPAYDDGERYGPAPGIGWDLGAIGKGYIVDAALTLLRDHGLPNATVDAGGNLAVRGTCGQRAWRIGVRDPREPAASAQLLATLDAFDEAVITHGDDQRCFEHGGRRYAHILDPQSGWPVQGLRSLTVVHADAGLADGAGSALFVAGLQGWPALARRLGITQVLAVSENGAVQCTPDIRPRLRPRSGVRIETVPG